MRILLTFVCLALALAEGEEEFTFSKWKDQIEGILQETHKWKRVMESAMAQFALAQFPENFTPETFSKGVNETLVLSQQKTTLRSMIYHRALSTMDTTLTIQLPPGVTTNAGVAILEELHERGFPAYLIDDGKAIFFAKKIKSF